MSLFPTQPHVFYDFSGGMESAAMLVMDIHRIRETEAIVRWADTGKQFPEMAASIEQIQKAINYPIVRVAPRITFEQFLFEKGGMLRKGTNDCSRRMKRANLMAHLKTFRPPYEVNLGFNNTEQDRADSFTDRNERDWCHWRFPLIEMDISREDTQTICKKAGFTILCDMYEKMGRFDCYFCPNQKPSQAFKVIQHYPDLAEEWHQLETRKGHSFMRVPLPTLAQVAKEDERDTGCACFGGEESVWEDGEVVCGV